MEALIAVGLASNVVQFVDFGMRATSICRQIYKDGATVEQQDLKSLSILLSSVSADIEKNVRNVQVATALNKSETELLDLAQRCIGKADKLKQELDKTLRLPNDGVRALLKKSFASMMRGRAIDELRQQLERDQHVLDTSLLASLQQSARDARLLHLDLEARLGEDRALLVRKLAQGISTVWGLVEAEGLKIRQEIRDESRATRDHITQQMQILDVNLSLQDRRKAVLDSLHFPEINLRQEQVPEAYINTFKFLFDESDKAMKPWFSFLCSSGGFFWWSGKPGAGKSVAMNLVVDDNRIRPLLFSSPSGRTSPLVVSFFVWNAGEDLQNTLVGFLRSILHQLLISDQTLFERIAGVDQTLNNRNPTKAWSEKELKTLVNTAISYLDQPLCLFLDGVDEFKEELGDVLAILELIHAKANVKICVSGRPWLRLETKVKCCEYLNLQDFTRESIKLYVQGRLEKDAVFQHFSRSKALRGCEHGADLVEQVLDKAQGVFLWVRLAVDQILGGISDDDSWKLLFQRLNSIPDKIEEIYEKMWRTFEKRNHVYKKDAMRSFQYILDRELSLLEFMIATDQDLQDLYLREGGKLSNEAVVHKCREKRTHIQVRCAGFLEVVMAKRRPFGDEPLSDHLPVTEADKASFTSGSEDVQNGGDGPRTKNANEKHLSDVQQLRAQHQWYTVSFLHRTAADFIRGKIKSRELGAGDPDSEQNVSVPINHVRCRCVLWKMDDRAGAKLSFYEEVDQMSFIFNGEVPSVACKMVEQTIHEIIDAKDSDHAHLKHLKIAYDFLGALFEGGACLDALDRVIDLKAAKIEYLDYLLICACLGMSDSPRLDDTSDLIFDLLQAGARPMVIARLPTTRPIHLLQGLSAWKLYLLSQFSRLTLGDGFLSTKVVKRFLDAGAALDFAIPLCLTWVDFGRGQFHTFGHIFSPYAMILMCSVRQFLQRLGFGSLLSVKLINDGEATYDEPRDRLEVVLARGEKDGNWFRIQSREDANEILDVVLAAGVGYPQKTLRDFLLGPSRPGHFPPSAPSATEDVSEDIFESILDRSLEITTVLPYEEWKIDGWKRQTFVELSISNVSFFRAERDLVTGMGLPHQFLYEFLSPDEIEGLDLTESSHVELE